MGATKQAAALDAAQRVINMMTTLKSLRASAKALIDEYNSESYSTEWAAMPTATQNADGSLGAADGSPVTSHPITTGGVNRSQASLVAGMVCLQDLLNFCQNGAVSAAQRSQTIDDLAS